MAGARRTRKRPGRKTKGWRRRTPKKALGGGTITYRKLKLDVATTIVNHGGSYTRVVDIQIAINDPSTCANFASYAALYDSFRVSAVKVQFIPSWNTEVPGTTYGFLPGYGIVDFNSTPTWLAYTSLINFDNLKFVNMYRPWKRYIRCPKLTSNTSSPDGWQRTSAAGTQTGYFALTTPELGAGMAADVLVGHHLITWYCKFRSGK